MAGEPVPMLEFRVLGSLDLRGSEGEVVLSVLSQPKRVALLSYLAIATPRGFHRRDKLVGLFWPGLDQDRARAALRKSLHHLRRSLGEDAVLRRGDEEVSLNWDLVQLDVARFEDAAEGGRPEETLELYRGSLLEGFHLSGCQEFGHWLEAERERVKYIASRAAWALAHRYLSAGLPADAERMGRRAMALVPTDEVEIRRFIRALAGAGDRAAAVGFYEKFAENLGEELELRPNAESRDLVEGIRASAEFPVQGEGRVEATTGGVRLPEDQREPSEPPGAPSSTAGPLSDGEKGAENPEEDFETFRRAVADRYLIQREIGRGGMATVYLAQDLKHDRKVAMKVVSPELGRSLGARRFLREIKTAAKLTHPHILPLFDSGEAYGFLFYVMPYVKGESLRARLTREKQLPIEDALQITREIADALAHAHDEGIIHRDVKPANIMLEAGHAVLADFGVAQAVAEARDDQLTQTGSSLGTPAYMSPEQAAGARDLDGRTDQYALGCVLYEMLTGHPPFTGTRPESVMRRHLMDEPPPVTQDRSSVPEAVVGVVQRALAKSPADRFRTAGEMAAALAPVGAPVRRRPALRWIRAGAVGGGLGVAAVALMGIWIFWPGREAAEPGSALGSADDRPSVAVLMFENRSGREEDADFTDGLREEIVTQLYKIGGLKLSARKVLEYRDNPKEPREIGEDLNVRYILYGGVERAGEEIRIHVRLTEATTEELKWADSFAGSAENLLSVQNEIVATVTDSVQAVVTPGERSRIAARPTENPLAYETYLEGVGRFEEAEVAGPEGEAASREAIDLLQEAVRLDPAFGMAHAKLAYAHLSRWWFGHDLTGARVELARGALDQALMLSPDLGETYVALGWVRYWADRDYEGAIEAFQEARRRLPGDPEPYEAMGFVRRRQGRYQEALVVLEDVFRQDPRDGALADELSLTYGAIRENEEAAAWAERAILLSGAPSAFGRAARAYLRQGDIERARAVLSRAPDSASAFVIEAGFLVEAYARDFQAAASWLRRAPGPILEFQEQRRPAALYWARLHGWAGRPDEARQAFRQAVTELRARDQGGGKYLAVAYAGLAQRELAEGEIDATVREWRAEPDFFDRPIPFPGMAVVRILLGDHDAAVELLEELATLEYDFALTVADLQLDPTWDPLRDYPRFEALVEMGGGAIGR